MFAFHVIQCLSPLIALISILYSVFLPAYVCLLCFLFFVFVFVFWKGCLV